MASGVGITGTVDNSAWHQRHAGFRRRNAECNWRRGHDRRFDAGGCRSGWRRDNLCVRCQRLHPRSIAGSLRFANPRTSPASGPSPIRCHDSPSAPTPRAAAALSSDCSSVAASNTMERRSPAATPHTRACAAPAARSASTKARAAPVCAAASGADGGRARRGRRSPPARAARALARPRRRAPSRRSARRSARTETAATRAGFQGREPLARRADVAHPLGRELPCRAPTTLS